MGRRSIAVVVLVVLACAGGGDAGRGGPPPFGTSPGTSTTGSGTTEGNDSDPSTSSSGVGTSASTTDGSSSVASVATSTSDDPTTGGPVGPPACPVAGAPIDCSPGPGSGENDTCTDDPSCFLQTVKNAVTGVIAERPELFQEMEGMVLVLDHEAYMNAVVERIIASGECSIRDPNAGDELVVKHDNAFAENFDVLTFEGYARWGDGIYTSKCIPAWF